MNTGVQVTSETLTSFPLDKCPEAGLLDRTVFLFLMLLRKVHPIILFNDKTLILFFSPKISTHAGAVYLHVPGDGHRILQCSHRSKDRQAGRAVTGASGALLV